MVNMRNFGTHRQNIIIYKRSTYPLEYYVLKINENPTLRELHNTAFSFSVLETNYLPKSWILENFLVLRYNQTLTYDVPFFLKWNCFSRKYVFYYRKMNIEEKIMMYIHRGYYVYMELNEFYIPNRPSYKKQDFYHDILIYGYSKKDQTFLTIAYNKDGLYKTQTVHFSNILEAYKNYKHKYELKIMPFCISKKYDFSNFNKKTVCKNLSKMLYSPKKHLGKNAYVDLLNHIDSVIAENVRIDLRAFRTISEYSGVLLYLNDFFDITESDYSSLLELKSKSDYIFLLAIKYSITLSKTTIDKIKNEILTFIKIQKIVLENIYKQLHKK